MGRKTIYRFSVLYLIVLISLGLDQASLVSTWNWMCFIMSEIVGVLAPNHAIRLVGWPKHVNFSLSNVSLGQYDTEMVSCR